MKQFMRPEFTLLNKGDNNTNGTYSMFEIQPLERGFGITLGNAIRRTLLAATPGAAVFAIKIAGAAHEFTSINGIVENVSRIILNIKQLVLKVDANIYKDEEVVELKINSTTVGTITAGDLILPAGVEVLNPELHILTISEGGVLDLVLFAKNSRGYKSFKDNKNEKNLEVGAITIDSNYSPIVKASYNVLPINNGKTIDLEKLNIEVTTDGSITSTDAIATAAKVLTSHLEFFINLNQEIDELDLIGVADDSDKELDKKVEDLEFTQRSLNCLKRAQIHTLGDLVSKTEDEIEEIRNLGKKSLKEIKDKVSQLNLSFKQY
ncbi:DNA-directed RNA polymerase subunit alpha [Mesoplasma photuris]|uniref:DNA-directed RNA polymerase subunit alpha n=1 Tax=Mesoplasma photuris TaxID=217731 RepID=UPI0004E1A84D|nr:DNA-directed RNA polymerase subunit alpha [Mesoplasma photuris]